MKIINILFIIKQFVQKNSLSSADAKKCHQFCTMHSLKQLIQFPTRVMCSTSTLSDHVLASFPLRAFQKGVIKVGLSDHQLIFCTRKISKFKTSGIYKYINFRL